MISLEQINLGIAATTILVLLVYMLRFILRYKHQYESNILCTSAVLFCLTIVILSTFLLPVDLYLISIIKFENGTLTDLGRNNETLQTIDKSMFAAYYSLYGIIGLLIFIVIPFLHFFNEESESSSDDRLHNAIKYTFGFALIAVIFILVGFLVPVSEPDPSAIIESIVHILEAPKIQQGLTLVLSMMTIAGLANISFYTATGLFCWPIGLLMGTSSVTTSLSRLNDREVALTVKVNNLRQKERSDRLTLAEQNELLEAENELRELERDEVVLSGYKHTMAYRLRNLIRPLQIIAGILFGSLSIFILTTLIIVNVDRILHGAGPKQGYILTKPVIFNPLEWVLKSIHSYAVVGPLPLLIITCYLVIATISGIRNLGLWFLFARIHRIRVGRTQPQALLYFCITMMLTVYSFDAFLFSLSSKYITFGDQNYISSTGNSTQPEECHLENYQAGCILTKSSILTMRMISQVWFVGAVMYWWNWVFVGIASISLIACLVRGKRKATHGIVSDEDEFED